MGDIRTPRRRSEMLEVPVEFWIELTLIGKIGVSVASFVVGVLLAMLVDFVIRRRKSKEFEKIFGIAPEHQYSAMKIQMPKVRRELSFRARMLGRLFNEEEDLLRKYTEKRASPHQCEDNLSTWKQIKWEVKQAKKAFWTAYNLAKKYFGYPLQGDSWKDFV